MKSAPSKLQIWLPIIVFYVLACAWSWPFFWWRDMHKEDWVALQIPQYLKTWSIMWGPGFSALLCSLIFKDTKKILSFTGSRIWWSVLAWVFPFTVMILLNQKWDMWPMLFMGYISILGEELGWRGWLQNNIPIKSDIQKAICIGVLWELWHFTARYSPGFPVQTLIRLSIFILALCLVSFIMIKVTDRTSSLTLAVVLHAAIDMSFEFDQGWMAVLISIPLWIFLVWKWPKDSISGKVHLQSNQ